MEQKDTDTPSQLTNHRENSSAPFDPTRMVGITKRKALIKDVASAYQAAIFKCCQELLEIQKEESFAESKFPEETKKETRKPRLKHLKKAAHY